MDAKAGEGLTAHVAKDCSVRWICEMRAEKVLEYLDGVRPEGADAGFVSLSKDSDRR
jgi:hypothetical protein